MYFSFQTEAQICVSLDNFFVIFACIVVYLSLSWFENYKMKIMSLLFDV